jgi:hypothetical protein
VTRGRERDAHWRRAVGGCMIQRGGGGIKQPKLGQKLRAALAVVYVRGIEKWWATMMARRRQVAAVVFLRAGGKGRRNGELWPRELLL